MNDSLQRNNWLRSELSQHIHGAFGFAPTAEQEQAISMFCQFYANGNTAAHATAAVEKPVMILCGAAGTGKTTLAAAIVQGLASMKQKMVLLAPTGRAAKVFALYAGHAAYTIHRRIYRQRSSAPLIPSWTEWSAKAPFSLNANLHRDTLFIVDEASMIANHQETQTPFGSGCLLDDLVEYVYSGENCKMLLIGDRAQLPPVGQQQSPALSASMMAAYGLHVSQCNLNQVLRQAEDSGILWNATRIRETLEPGVQAEPGVGTALRLLPVVSLKCFADIHVVPGDELIETLASSYSRVGMDETIVITRSNKQAGIYNKGIRQTVLDREEELCRGDQIMVVKNNYYYTGAKPSPQKTDGRPTGPAEPVRTLDFIANGDVAVVQRVRNVHQLYGFRFADVTLLFPDYDDFELTATTLLDTLNSEAPALTRQQQEQLYAEVMEDYADLPHKADRLKQLKNDAHYNALQVKFGYAVTCHKAQGGQWAHVYIDQGYMTDDMLTPDYIHWLYTAFTRATEHLYLVNWPPAQTTR